MEKKRLTLVPLLVLASLSLAFVPSSGQQGSPYDPWQDYNGDGIVDANDLQAMGQTYGSSGSPTKNVNVMNFPLDEQGNLRVAQMNQEQNLTANVKLGYYQWCSTMQINGSSWRIIDLATSGYEQVFLRFYSTSHVATYLEFYVSHQELTFPMSFETFTLGPPDYYIQQASDVKGSSLRISFWNGNAIQVSVVLGVYMTA